MATSVALHRQFFHSLTTGQFEVQPYRHWLLHDVITPAACHAVVDLPFKPPAVDDTLGKRETHNSTRIFFSEANQARFAVCHDMAEMLQAESTVRRLSDMGDVDLRGSFLRIEYCQDTDGFWLEPHTDIGAKLFTMLIYLSDAPGSEDWGTDIYDMAGQRRVGTAPYGFNRGLIFIPGQDTWHGFEKRPIHGVRKSIIVNYVKDEWRARHELAFPDRPVSD